jgi:hypothetical protein
LDGISAANPAADEARKLRVLLQSGRGNPIGRLYHRYVMGDSQWGILSSNELCTLLKWNDADTDANERRIDAIKEEFRETTGILKQQFSKIGALIALLGFVIAIGLARQDGGSRLALIVVCFAAIFAVWAQSPRFKVIFRFRWRQDAGLRAGALTSQWDVFYYYYVWVKRREHTTNAIETLVIAASIFTVVALGFVMFTA